MKNKIILLSLILWALSACNRQQSATVLNVPSIPQKQKPSELETANHSVKTPITSFPPSVHLSSKRYYEEALKEIEEMLQDKTSSSFKKAVFLVENAYFDNRLQYENYEAIINQMSDFCRTIKNETIIEDSYLHEDKDEMMSNLAIFRFISDTLSLNVNGIYNLEMNPFSYNFADFAGIKEWKSTFVTELMITGNGNCHSLPYLYKILANELNASAYLALTPNHLYLTHPNEEVGWYNTELTSRSFPKDAWIMAAGRVTVDAIRSGIYMKSLTERESIALTLIDLAQGYEKRFGQSDYYDFVLECVEKALEYYPKNINAMLLKARILSKKYKNTQTSNSFEELENLCQKIIGLGYIPMPQAVYQEWLEISDEEKYSAEASTTYYKTQHQNQSNYHKNALTLSNGRYDEFLVIDSLVQFGDVVYDTYQHKIVSWIKNRDSGGLEITADMVGRMLSVDPLARDYPNLSPYVYAADNPILYVDVDGKFPGLAILIAKGAIGAVIDASFQFGLNLALNGGNPEKAFDDIDWGGVAFTGLQGLNPLSVPGGKYGKAALDVASDIGFNYMRGQYDSLHGGALTEKLVKDFFIGYIASVGTEKAAEKLGVAFEHVKKWLNNKSIENVKNSASPLSRKDMAQIKGGGVGLAYSSSLKSIPLKSTFKGEALPKNYKDNRIDFKINNGTIDFDGKKPGQYAFVMTSSGELRIGTTYQGTHYHLSDGADSVRAAGHIVFGKNGQIVEINNMSGHYRQGNNKSHTDNVLDVFNGNNIIDDETMFYGNGALDFDGY